MSDNEQIESDEYASFTCLCGNTPDAMGFYPCDLDGAFFDTPQDGNGLYCCDQCGRIIAEATLQVIARRK